MCASEYVLGVSDCDSFMITEHQVSRLQKQLQLWSSTNI